MRYAFSIVLALAILAFPSPGKALDWLDVLDAGLAVREFFGDSEAAEARDSVQLIAPLTRGVMDAIEASEHTEETHLAREFIGLELKDWIEVNREEFFISVSPGTERGFELEITTEIVVSESAGAEMESNIGGSIDLVIAEIGSELRAHLERHFQIMIGSTRSEVHSVGLNGNYCDKFRITISDRIAIGDLRYLEAEIERSIPISITTGSNLHAEPICAIDETSDQDAPAG